MVANGKDGASYLTGAKGMALYTFKKDTPVKSACAGDCVTSWPPYHQEKVGYDRHLLTCGPLNTFACWFMKRSIARGSRAVSKTSTNLKTSL